MKGKKKQRRKHTADKSVKEYFLMIIIIIIFPFILTGICDSNIRLCYAKCGSSKKNQEAHMGCGVGDEFGHWATHNGAKLLGYKNVQPKNLKHKMRLALASDFPCFHCYHHHNHYSHNHNHKINIIILHVKF